MSDKLDTLTEKMAAGGRVPGSEDDLANRFSTEHVDGLRYCWAWRQWLVWDQSRWRRDTTVRVYDLVRESCSHAAALRNEPSK